MNQEPYEASKIPDHWPDSPKREVVGEVVAVSGLRLKKRGTILIHPRSRVFPKYSIAELTVTDDERAAPSETVESVLYIGFFEVHQGGIVVVGEPVRISKREIGHVAGFSDVHSPNHLNLLVRGNEKFVEEYLIQSADKTVISTDIKLEDEVAFG